MEVLIRDGRIGMKPSKVAELLDVNVATVYRWAHTGYLPAYLVNGRILIDRNAFDAWLDAKRNNGGMNHAGRSKNSR